MEKLEHNELLMKIKYGKKFAKSNFINVSHNFFSWKFGLQAPIKLFSNSSWNFNFHSLWFLFIHQSLCALFNLLDDLLRFPFLALIQCNRFHVLANRHTPTQHSINTHTRTTSARASIQLYRFFLLNFGDFTFGIEAIMIK